MLKRAVVAGVAFAGLVLGGVSIAASEPPEVDATLSPPPAADAGLVTAANAEEGPANADAFGLLTQDAWIGATQFKPRSGGGLTYQTLYYWTNSNTQAEAQILLPAGAQVTGLECFFNDTNAGANQSVGMWRQSYNYSTDSPSVTNVTTVSSSGSTGYQKQFQSINETIKFRDGDLRNIYTLIWTTTANDPTLTFRGCRFFWNRQVTPAPASATFGDVPTTSGQFRFVEALVAAGITSGCGGGNYCPDTAVTRGQMAVFLSAALGLHWPY